jgi:uncharacterized protein
MRPLRPLSLLETRVLGVLIEKQHTVPDSYPLSLNSLTLGCNQKSARDPVIDVTEADVQVAIDELKRLSLVMDGPASRVTRYAHNAERVLRIPSQSVALLATFMLRGAQTSGELRINTERLHKFADISAVEGFLDELATRSEEAGGALAIKLARAPGEREARWAHLLSGSIEVALYANSHATDEATPSATNAVASSEIAVMKHEIAALKNELASLQQEVQGIKAALGM